MKKGHRRTQSANLAGNVYDQPIPVPQYQSPHKKNNILHLLQKCSGNAKQKVCNIQSLNAPQRGQDDKMFNFGKGLLKVSLQGKNKPEKKNNLVAIPQKFKQSPKIKKNTQPQMHLKLKHKIHLKSILKLNNKEHKRSDVDFAQGVNKLIKIKLGGQSKYRKLSMYQGSRSISKTCKHKKQISNIK